MRDSDRTVGYPYMIHGSLEHELLLVDFANTIPFYQSLAGQLEFSETKKTTGSGKHDAYERTSVFDERVAERLTSLPDVEARVPTRRSCLRHREGRCGATSRNIPAARWRQPGDRRAATVR